MKEWFTAHKEGLRQIHERLVERRGFGIIGGELYQNVMDTDATECIFTIEKIPGKPRVRIQVEDNGHGFRDLTHAWTMYAPSDKKHDPTKAGRFNIGEKIVLSFAYEASIHTTSGTVVFNSAGCRPNARRKRDTGTVFEAELACNQRRFDELITYLHRIIVRPGLRLVVNDEEIARRDPIEVFDVSLSTEIGDDLRPSKRKTKVEIYERANGEATNLCELGIPVVEIGDSWHYNVLQKVPLNVDRDNVTPGYLRTVRVAVFNKMHLKINEEDVQAPWIEEATSSPDCTDEAIEAFRVKKYGEKSLANDPSDPESNKRATAKGYTVIPPRGLTKGQRENLKRAGTLKSCGEAFPTPKPYSDDPNAPPVDVIPREKWSGEMKLIADYTEALGGELLDHSVTVRYVNTNNYFEACYGPCGRFDYNVRRLGRKWFDGGINEQVDSLIVHEFGHHFCGDHLDEKYYEALCQLAAKLKRLALVNPGFFSRFEQ